MSERGKDDIFFFTICIRKLLVWFFYFPAKTIMLVEAKAHTNSGSILFLASLAAFGSLAYFAYNKIDRERRERFFSDLQYRGRCAIRNLFPHSVDEYIALMEYDRATA